MPEKAGTDTTPKKKRKYTLQPLDINGQVVQPGENAVVGINVGTLPSDTRIYINIFVFRSEKPGPVMLVMGGVHGDEINGIEIVRQALDTGMFNHLRRGTVIAIPLLNVYGFINFSRDVPDGKDVNRSFPGNMRGSLASRVARVISKRVMPLTDIAIDFHTGGASRYNYPQVRYTRTSTRGFRLARDFGAPFILKKALIRKSLRKVAREMQVPMIVYEGGEALRLDGFSIEKGMQGLKNVMLARRMIEGQPVKTLPQPQVLIEKTSWIRAANSGMFKWSKSSGVMVTKGEPLGVITDPYGAKKISVLANRSGYIIGHNNAPVVSLGDALFNIGYAYRVLEPGKGKKRV